MEQELNTKIKELFLIANNGDMECITKLSNLSEIIKLSNSKIITGFESELHQYIKTHPLNKKVSALMGQNKIVNSIRMNGTDHPLKEIDFTKLIPVIFNNKTYPFIKLALLFESDISQKIILIENIQGMFHDHNKLE